MCKRLTIGHNLFIIFLANNWTNILFISLDYRQVILCQFTGSFIPHCQAMPWDNTCLFTNSVLPISEALCNEAKVGTLNLIKGEAMSTIGCIVMRWVAKPFIFFLLQDIFLAALLQMPDGDTYAALFHPLLCVTLFFNFTGSKWCKVTPAALPLCAPPLCSPVCRHGHIFLWFLLGLGFLFVSFLTNKSIVFCIDFIIFHAFNFYSCKICF